MNDTPSSSSSSSSSRQLLLRETIAGSASGAVCTLIGHPLDCVKVAQQTTTTTTSVATSALRTARTMMSTTGPSAFTRGVAPPLACSVLVNAVTFVSFAETSRWWGSPLAAGIASGVATAYLTTPFDWIKIQAQTTAATTSRRRRRRRWWWWEIATRRPSRLLTGHVANLGREGVFTCLYLGLYHHVRDRPTTTTPPTLPFVVATSSLTGGLAWLACYPFDTIKSIQQAASPWSSSSSSSRDSLRTLTGAWAEIRRRGRRDGTTVASVLYRGAGASLLRACLVTSSRLVTYEYAMRWLTSP